MDVTNFKHMGGHVLHLWFSDGTEGDVDFAPLIADGPTPLVELKDVDLFRRVRIEDGTVAWPNGADIAVETLYAVAHGFERPMTFDAVQAMELAMSLRELRTHEDKRQEDLATALEVTQGAVSRLEANVGEAKLSTLRRYVKALGWDVEVVAVRGDHRVRLRGV